MHAYEEYGDDEQLRRHLIADHDFGDCPIIDRVRHFGLVVFHVGAHDAEELAG